MKFLIRFSTVIDNLNERVGRAALWLVLVTVLICAANAVVRKTFNFSSNALLEIQWYLYAAVFLLCAGYTLKHDCHVRIDILYNCWSLRNRAIIDLIGSALFLLPMAILIAWNAWPSFIAAYQSGEMSSDAGGLLRWPVQLLIPLGFTLLALQGISEMIKRTAFLLGYCSTPNNNMGES